MQKDRCYVFEAKFCTSDFLVKLDSAAGKRETQFLHHSSKMMKGLKGQRGGGEGGGTKRQRCKQAYQTQNLF